MNDAIALSRSAVACCDPALFANLLTAGTQAIRTLAGVAAGALAPNRLDDVEHAAAVELALTAYFDEIERSDRPPLRIVR